MRIDSGAKMRYNRNDISLFSDLDEIIGISNNTTATAALQKEYKMKVTKESIIGDILDYDVETAVFFFEIGMHCLGCPASRGESIEMACAVHGVDADALVEKLNKYFEDKASK